MNDVIQRIDANAGIKCAGVVVLTTKATYASLPLSMPICTTVATTSGDLTDRFDDTGITIESGSITVNNTSGNPIPVNMTNDLDICICDLSVGITGGYVGVTGDVSITASDTAGLKVDNHEILEMQEQILAELIKQNIHLESMTDERILDVDIETQGVI